MPATAGAIFVKAARLLVIDRAGRDRQHREGGEGREERHEVKYGSLPEGLADQTGETTNEDVPSAVGRASFPAQRSARPARSARPRVMAATVGREHRPQHRHDDVCREHDRQRRRPGDRQRAGGQGGDAGDEQAALEAGGVDKRANRRVKRDADQPTRGERRTNGRLSQ